MDNEGKPPAGVELQETLAGLEHDLAQARSELAEIIAVLRDAPPAEPEEVTILEEEIEALQEEIRFLEEDISEIEAGPAAP